MNHKNSESIKGVIYDENGQRLFVNNIDVLTFEMSDSLLVNTYRNTVYQKTLFVEALSLKESIWF